MKEDLGYRVTAEDGKTLLRFFSEEPPELPARVSAVCKLWIAECRSFTENRLAPGLLAAYAENGDPGKRLHTACTDVSCAIGKRAGEKDGTALSIDLSFVIERAGKRLWSHRFPILYDASRCRFLQTDPTFGGEARRSSDQR